MTKVKAGVACALVIASVVMPLMVQHQAQARLRNQDEALREQTAQLAKLQADNVQLSKLLAAAKNSRSLSDDQFNELMRLRGQVGRLRTEVREFAQAKTNAPRSQTDIKEYQTRTVSVIGQVNKPGVIALPAEQRLDILEAITQAGDLTNVANKNRIEVSRNGRTHKFTLDELKKQTDPEKKLWLEPGDVIFVHESFF